MSRENVIEIVSLQQHELPAGVTSNQRVGLEIICCDDVRFSPCPAASFSAT